MTAHRAFRDVMGSLGPLRYSNHRAAAELAPAKIAQGLTQSSPKSPDGSAFLGGSQGILQSQWLYAYVMLWFE